MDNNTRTDITIARLSLSFLWFVLSLFVMFSLVLFRKVRHMSSRLILSLILVLMLESIGHLLSFFDWDDLCTTQAILLQFSKTAQLGWIVVVSFNLYFVILNGESREQYEVLYHILVWCGAITFTLFAIYFSPIGFNDLWCWLQYTPFNYMTIFVFYGPLLVAFCTVTTLHVMIWRIINTRMARVENDWSVQQKKTLKMVTRRLIVYPSLLFLYSVPALNLFVIFHNNVYVVFSAIISVLIPLLGIMTVCIYGLDSEMRHLWLVYCSNRGCICGCNSEMGDIARASVTQEVFFVDERTSLVESISRRLFSSTRQ